MIDKINFSSGKKTAPFIAGVLLLCLVFLAGCNSARPAAAQPTPHVHTWAEANCERPATCTVCGETRGEALGHSWVAATTEKPRHCRVCGATDGAALAPTSTPHVHIWMEADCVHPATCTVCGETRGKALGHSWVEATYEEPKHCKVCGATEGKALTPTPTPAPSEKEWPPYPLENTDIVPPSASSCWLDTPQQRIVTAENDAYQFSAPDDHADRFSTVKRGSVVEMIAQEGQYGLCVSNGQILGWVRVKWLEPYRGQTLPPKQTPEPSTPQNPNALVTDAYRIDTEVEAGYYYSDTTVSFAIPKININSAYVDSVNKFLYDELYPQIETNIKWNKDNGAGPYRSWMKYEWHVNGDILTLIATNHFYFSATVDYVYNIYIHDGTEVSDRQLYEYAGFSAAEGKARLRDAMGSCFCDGYWEFDQEQRGADGKEIPPSNDFLEMLEFTVSKNNVSKAQLYLNEKGELCASAEIGSLIEAGCYLQDVNVSNFKPHPFYLEYKEG